MKTITVPCQINIIPLCNHGNVNWIICSLVQCQIFIHALFASKFSSVTRECNMTPHDRQFVYIAYWQREKKKDKVRFAKIPAFFDYVLFFCFISFIDYNAKKTKTKQNKTKNKKQKQKQKQNKTKQKTHTFLWICQIRGHFEKNLIFCQY